MKNKRKIISILLSIIIIVFFPVLSISKENKNCFLGYGKERISLEYFSEICLTPGEDESMLNFSWYSRSSQGSSKIKIREEDEKERIFEGESIDIGNGFISNKVTVTNLKANTTYIYSYESDGLWSQPLEYKTQDFQNYAFVFMADPQIGASSKKTKSNIDGVEKDAYNWNKVIKKSVDKSNNPSFIVCGGDVTNATEDGDDLSKTYTSNLEYAGFLSPDYLRYIPIANAVGNHDKDNENFYNHFNVPNLTNLGETVAGGDYYFTYGNTLYLFINTNNLNILQHKKFIDDTIEKNKDIKWKIAVFHHDIYGGGRHEDDKDMKILRSEIPPILEDNKIDLVLCGHDHIYSRTYPLKNNKKIMNFTVERVENSKEKVDIIKNNNEGITYITGSSSTGSKFYKQDKNKNKYIKKIYCEEIPTYTVIEIKQDLINIVTYEVNEDKPVDNKIIIQK
ncbi:purple acid phosphatase family protein [Terrisporobacter hibernicus]|uniref:Metallophosphoesterase family protein n=1 Tax=Terrisporobacter hibernicus TaxID=2813371 RepID=A0AAX2ZF08_9FIRM|nr:metallophosphoesterase family protein [Terrisporobacter hibernicus]UEL46282.1 metallophosphoesterase family protein [Terrisporobacter hibernicus]